MQETASQTVLKRICQQHMVQMSEVQVSDFAAIQPELLAHHYTEAECREQVVTSYHSYQHGAGREALLWYSPK